MSRVQLALRVPDLPASIAFYSKFFGTEPAELRGGYADFAIVDQGLATDVENDTTRCYALQDKVWSTAPARNRGRCMPSRPPPTRWPGRRAGPSDVGLAHRTMDAARPETADRGRLRQYADPRPGEDGRKPSGPAAPQKMHWDQRLPSSSARRHRSPGPRNPVGKPPLHHPVRHPGP